MSRIKTNIIYNLLYQVLILLIPLITAPYLSRVLEVKGIGVYSYVSSIAYYFFLFITLGLNNYGNRCIAKCEKNKKDLGKMFFSIYTMQLIIGIIMITAYCVYTVIFTSNEFKLFFVLYFPYILSAVLDINWFYYGLTEFKFTTIRSTVIKIISLFFIFIFVKTKNDLAIYFLIMGLSYLLSNLLLWTRIRRYVTFYKSTFHETFVHLKPNLILFIPILAISIYRVMDKIMIKELSGILENGYYENADKIITMALTGFSAVATVMMPSVSSMVASGNSTKLKQLLRDSMQVSMALGIGMMFGLMAVGPVFAPLFFGREYFETGILIQLLAITVVISGWKAILRSQYLIPFEKDTSYVISLVVGAIVNVMCNFYFIPKYSARGAVIGTIIAEIVGFLIQTIVASKDIEVNTLIKDTLIFVPAGIIMFVLSSLIIYLIPTFKGLLLSIIIGIISYSGLCVFLFILFQRGRFTYLLNKYIKRSC